MFDYTGHMALGEAMGLLKEHYKNQYGNNNDVSVTFSLDRETGCSHEWGSNDVEYYTYYALIAQISFSMRVGSIVVGDCSIRKGEKDLENDLLEIFNKLYVDGEDKVVNIMFPTFGNDIINYDRNVVVYFKKNELSLNRSKK